MCLASLYYDEPGRLRVVAAIEAMLADQARERTTLSADAGLTDVSDEVSHEAMNPASR
jgi:hypothetical protein